MRILHRNCGCGDFISNSLRRHKTEQKDESSTPGEIRGSLNRPTWAQTSEEWGRQGCQQRGIKMRGHIGGGQHTGALHGSFNRQGGSQPEQPAAGAQTSERMKRQKKTDQNLNMNASMALRCFAFDNVQTCEL
eukprot:6199907-Pleurochrysis_carterae.AAC.2